MFDTLPLSEQELLGEKRISEFKLAGVIEFLKRKENLLKPLNGNGVLGDGGMGVPKTVDVHEMEEPKRPRLMRRLSLYPGATRAASSDTEQGSVNPNPSIPPPRGVSEKESSEERKARGGNLSNATLRGLGRYLFSTLKKEQDERKREEGPDSAVQFGRKGSDATTEMGNQNGEDGEIVIQDFQRILPKKLAGPGFRMFDGNWDGKVFFYFFFFVSAFSLGKRFSDSFFLCTFWWLFWL